MLKLCIFIGERDSLKDEIFNILPQFGENQVLYQKVIIKQSQQYLGKLLLNFPNINSVEEEIHHFFKLAQVGQIHQFAIFLNFDQNVSNRIINIKNKLQNQLKSYSKDIYTFFVNKSNQTYFDNKNRVYYVQNLNSCEKQQFSNWLLKNTYDYINQNNLQNYQDEVSEIIKEAKSNFITLLKQENNEANLLNILDNHKDNRNKPKLSLNKIYLNSEIEFLSDLILLALVAYRQDSSCIEFKNLPKFNQIRYCSNCQIIYHKVYDNWMYNQIYLFKFVQFNTEQEQLFECFSCSKQFNSYLGHTFISNILSIYLLQMIDQYFQQNIQLLENKKNGELDLIQQKDKGLALMLLSCENHQKQIIFKKVYETIEFHEHNQFNIGNTLLDQFYLIDSPLFCFDEDKDQKEAQFKRFFNKNPVHFIFFCIDYQRTSLMKERIMQMLKYLPNVNRTQMGIIIQNLHQTKYQSSNGLQQQYQTESEIKESLQRTLKQVIVITENDDVNDITNKIRNCVQNIQISEELSFKDTIFDIQEDETSQILLQQKLQLLSQTVENDYKEQQQRQILYYQQQQQQLIQKKQEFQDQIKKENKKFLHKKQELQYQYQKQIQEYETQLKKEVQHCELNIKDIDGQLQSIGKHISIEQKTYAQLNTKRKKYKKNRN